MEIGDKEKIRKIKKGQVDFHVMDFIRGKYDIVPLFIIVYEYPKNIHISKRERQYMVGRQII